MSLTNFVLLLLIVLFAAYLIYDRFIIEKLSGKTIKIINLKPSNRLDGFIFIVLLIIILYQNLTTNGLNTTNYLLVTLLLISSYTFFIRKPKLYFKDEGFFFANIYILYSRITEMQLAEDGALYIKLEQKSIIIKVTDIDELEEIYQIIRRNYLSE